MSVQITIPFYLQVKPFCSPLAHACFQEVASEKFPCNVSCIGLYADVQYLNYTTDCDQQTLLEDDYNKQLCSIQEEYHKYKNSFARNLVLMLEEELSDRDLLELTQDKTTHDNMYLKKYQQLQFFEIYFDTATYDEIERDVKVTWSG